MVAMIIETNPRAWAPRLAFNEPRAQIEDFQRVAGAAQLLCLAMHKTVWIFETTKGRPDFTDRSDLPELLEAGAIHAIHFQLTPAWHDETYCTIERVFIDNAGVMHFGKT
jgi:hypothetical protein